MLFKQQQHRHPSPRTATCTRCHQRIRLSETIARDEGKGFAHVACLEVAVADASETSGS